MFRYKSFLEARLADVLNIKGEGELTNQIRKIKDMKFEFEKNLVKLITLNKRLNGKKIQFKIEWNDSVSHDLVKRISNRTSFRSVDEFNEFFKKFINKIFPDMVGKELHTGRYGFYSVEYNITLIIDFDINKYNKGNYEIRVVTILPGRIAKNIIDFIDINESFAIFDI
jgi:hypothetical protein